MKKGRIVNGDFVERCMRAYKAYEMKVDEVNADAALCQMLEELQEAGGVTYGRLLGAYSATAAEKLRKTKFDPDRLAKRKLLYEQIDQRLTEVLLGLA